MMDPREFSEQALEFAKSDAVEELIVRLEGQYLEAWMNTSAEQSAHREHLWRMRTAVAQLRAALEAAARAPEITAFNRRRLEKLTGKV